MKHSMNPFDELSVEESVRIREKKTAPGGVEDICVISAGPPKAADVLRTAMAMGADRAIHVDVKEGEDLEPLTVAKLLQKVAEREKSNLVILGKQSIDDDAGQTGQMLAGLLGWAQATQASKVEFGQEGDSVSVTREVDGGVETLKAKLPMVVTTDLRLNEPRYASLPNIMKAKKKPLEKKTLADFGVENQRRLKVLKVTGRSRALPCGRRDAILTTSHRAGAETGWRQSGGCGRPRGEAQGARRYLGASSGLYECIKTLHNIGYQHQGISNTVHRVQSHPANLPVSGTIARSRPQDMAWERLISYSSVARVLSRL